MKFLNSFYRLSQQEKMFLAGKIVVFALISFWLFFFLAEKINLANSDIGRHLKNGEIMLNQPENRQALLHTNFYSYTETGFPFVNHHWLSGAVFFIIHKTIGFIGLSLAYIFLVWASFALMFHIAQKHSGFLLACFLAILLAPLTADRAEIRPEAFSYFFSALYFFLFWQYSLKKISFKKLLIIILPVQLFWVNIHIGFVFGFFIISVFLLQFLAQGFLQKKFSQFKRILILSLAVALMSLINPFGAKGLFYPLQIFQNFGYRLAENQSVWFLENFGMQNSNFFILKIATLLLIISFIWISILIFKKSNLPRKNWLINEPLIANFFIASFFCVMAWTASRNLSHFGIFALAALGINLGIIKNNLKFKIPKIDYSLIALGFFCLAGFILIINSKILPAHLSEFGLGLKKDNLAGIEFFKKNKLSGPIFNNYDVGGFLIYGLYPNEKVFTDNRPEAYPEKHFKETYIPMQENQEVWQQQNKEYNFNVIFFYRHDYTTWGQKFLVEKISDKKWVPVFVDDDVIIFIKNNDKNKNIIEKHRLPDEMFQVKTAGVSAQ